MDMNEQHVKELDKIIGGEEYDLMFRAFVGNVENAVTEDDEEVYYANGNS